MTVADAVVLFDAILLAGFVIDFSLWSRTSTSVVATPPLVIALAAFAWIAWREPAARGAEFAAVALVVTGSAWFGYANFLAFVKRGITFSIIHNHARPRAQRRADRDFIALADRIAEMTANGWIARHGDRWALTPAGRRIVTLRRTLLRLLRIEAVG